MEHYAVSEEHTCRGFFQAKEYDQRSILGTEHQQLPLIRDCRKEVLSLNAAPKLLWIGCLIGMSAVFAEVAPTLITVVIGDLNRTTSIAVIAKRNVLSFYVLLLGKLSSLRVEEVVPDERNHLVSLKAFLCN